jgi:hypothetical protein
MFKLERLYKLFEDKLTKNDYLCSFVLPYTRVNTALIAGLDLTPAPIAVPSTRYLTQI